jgi:ribulose-bisphosphate carboxylase large chain
VPAPSALLVTYRVRADARSIEARAQTIAIEQSVEMPLDALDDDTVRREIVGRVLGIDDAGHGIYSVRIALAAETVGQDAGQLINMLFGNTSIHDDVVLHDAEIPQDLAAAFGGPRHGIRGMRERVQAGPRPLTASALKPQGLSPARLAALAGRLAQGGIDYIKDDHGLADQAFSPFAARVEAVSAALRQCGTPTRYVPSLSGDLDMMRRQIAAARQAGIDTVMVAPMIMGFSNFNRLVRDNADMAFLAHPAMAGAARIAPPLLLGKLFPLLGADAVVYPNHGGRFGYSPETCRLIAQAARDGHDDRRHDDLGHGGRRPALPVPAGGMTTDRVHEMLDFYGPDIMLLIGGGLLSARDNLVAETSAFVTAVKNHPKAL